MAFVEWIQYLCGGCGNFLFTSGDIEHSGFIWGVNHLFVKPNKNMKISYEGYDSRRIECECSWRVGTLLYEPDRIRFDRHTLRKQNVRLCVYRARDKNGHSIENKYHTELREGPKIHIPKYYNRNNVLAE